MEIMLFISLSITHSDGSCFPCRKRKAKANALAAALSVATEREVPSTRHVIRQSDQERRQVQLVEEAVETIKEEELREEERQQNERRDAVRILARILTNLIERPRLHVSDYYSYCAFVHWTATPISVSEANINPEKQLSGKTLGVLILGEIFAFSSIFKNI